MAWAGAVTLSCTPTDLACIRPPSCHSAQARRAGVASCSGFPFCQGSSALIGGQRPALRSWPIRASKPQHRHRHLSLRAAAGSQGASKVQRLPIFPLSIVAVPVGVVPLNIFEARYRVLFNTLLSGAEGIDDGLVNESSPFVGSRKFGMCFVDQSGRVAVTGTVLHIEQHTKLESGQMIINSKGGERFAIKKIIEERPVLICDVELLEEAEEDAAEASRLAQELKTLFRDLVTLNLKMKKEKVPADVAEPPELTTLSPRDFSFWVAALLQDSPMTQQQLLEEDSTIKRLQREMDVLGGTVKYLRATSALESAFAPSSGEGSPPPQGGPD